MMSTMSPTEVSNPDTNLVTSFVAMAEGVSARSGQQLRDRVNSTTVTGSTVRVSTEVTTAGSEVGTTQTRENTITPSTTPVEANTTTVRATVESTPINEFSDLARILSNAFPMEFPFGVTPEELGSTGSMLKRVLRRLTRVYDGRVAHNYMLLMYVANLVYRHASLAATSARVDQESSAEVVNIVNHPEWRERAEIVANNPNGPEAKKLIKQISPLVRLAGKKVPWSPMERLSASYHIYSLYHIFGAPAFFITFSPKTLTNQIMLRFGVMQSPDVTVDLKLSKHLQHRVKLLTSNTIAQARAYELILDSVLSVLFGIQPDSRSHKTHMPKAGLFGIPTAYYGVTEVQSRNALHAHFVIWVRTMHPEMLQRIAHDDDLRQVLANAVDSVVTASTEHFEHCVSQSKVICKFDTKPYGIRYIPTDEWKSVELKSVVWGSRASKFSLTPGMKIVLFAGKNVRDMRSETVRDMIKGHSGPVTIVFERDTIFDPNSGELKKTSGVTPMTLLSSNHKELSVKTSDEFKRGVSTGSVAKTFVPPWTMGDTSAESSDGEKTTVSSRTFDNDHEKSKVTADDNDSDLQNRSTKNSPDSPDLVSKPPGESDINDLDPTKCPLLDNILDQDFSERGLKVGDIFFDGNNGDTCNVDDYTLGWVEVVATHRRSVFLSPIYSPQRPFIPKGLDDVPTTSREDVIDEEYMKRKLSRLPTRVLEVIRQRNCWEWNESLANKAAALHRLKVRGQIVMSAYNMHGFANGETQRRHSHRCHKYKDSYKAKWCTLGFGRSVFDQTDLRHIISEERDTGDATWNKTDKDSSNDDDDVDVISQVSEQKEFDSDDEYDDDDVAYADNSKACKRTGCDTPRIRCEHAEDLPIKTDKDNSDGDDGVVDNKSSKRTEFDELRVRNLEKPEPPPEEGTRDDRVLYLDLRRKCGIQPSELRQDVENVVRDTLTDRLCSQVVLVSRVHHRVMSFLCHPEDGHHTYSDQYLCETAPILAALLGCNTNVSPLGGNVQAINALFYLTGYLSKNPVKPTSWVMCIIAALKSTCRWESVAEDVGTASRNAKFFLQKVLNRLNALAEISDTQASMLLLGFKSFQCSHRFGFCFHRQALEAQVQLYNVKRTETTDRSDDDTGPGSDGTNTSGSDDNTDDDDSESDGTGVGSESDGRTTSTDDEDDSKLDAKDESFCDGDVHDDNSESDGTETFSDNDHGKSESDETESSSIDDVINDTSSEQPVANGTGKHTRSRTENVNEASPVPAGNMIYRDRDGVAFALSQHHHYLHRVRDWKATLPQCENGSHINDLAWWYQHARGINNPVWRSYQRNKGLHHFTLTEYVRHIEVVEMPESLPTSGPVKYYLFSRKHPICDSHVQKLRSKHLITVLSGRPPRHPGPMPQDRSTKSGMSYDKRLLAWKLKADLYGRTMGSIFSPWNKHGDCGVHSYEDFQRLEKEWTNKLRELRVERGWRQFISRDRSLDDGDVVYPSPELFPDPRFAARRQHAHNLGVNLRVPKLMKSISNKWRYQHSDRFDNPKEYDFLNNDDGDMSNEDKENALAIASLLETFSDKKRGSVTGVGVDTADHLDRMRKQVERLYGVTTRARHNISKIYRERGLDPDWYRKPLTGNFKWAKETFKELMTRTPDVITPVVPDGFTTSGTRIEDYDDSLREQMSPDKIPAFDEAIGCFDSNKPLRIFVHGGPGTGKSFLAECIMKAASVRGLVSRFTALSGAAATINEGTTLHYATGMTQRTKWGSDPSANQIKQIRERNTNMRLLIIDEISMTHAQMWNQVRKHLEHSKLWDTLHLIAMGDFCQLPPPSQFENALYKDFVLAARKPASYSSKPLVLAGIKSFQTLKKIELSIQNRAKDPEHTKSIRQLREGEINDEFINNLRSLTSSDLRHDWRFVPILVTSNAEGILLNKRQIVEFAKAHKQFILKWTNPIKNCQDSQEYDINIVEGIIPEAVQYFCMGAPALINSNKNPVGTGIVNGYRVLLHSLVWKENPWRGPEKGWKPGQIFEVHRPSYMVVIKDPDVTKKNLDTTITGKESEEDNDNVDPELIPLRTDHYKTWVQGVKIQYNAFPLDLRFAITYHKVQGQTMDKVILFLHERKSKQLAPLQWESLYVAYTRVKRGDDIRVCYFGSDDSSDRLGLKHLGKLRRPELYDVWQSAYDDQGRWNDRELREQAKREQTKLRRKLRRVTSIVQVSLNKLKEWANILDVNVGYKPGTKRKNKPQYVEAITPIWAGINGGVLTTGSNKDTVSRSSRHDSRLSSGPTQSKGHQKRNRGSAAAPTTSSRRNRQHNNRVLATPPPLTERQRRNVTLATRQLNGYRRRFRTRRLAKPGMHRITYCLHLDYVDQLSQWSAFALATKGEFIDDTVIYYFGSHFCEGDNTKAHVVDPILMFGSESLLKRGIRDKYLSRLHERGETLLFPINAPVDLHWMLVVVWMNVSSGKITIQCRNSMKIYSTPHEDKCCKLVETFMRSMYEYRNNTVYTCPGFVRSVPITWTEQTPGVYACGLHVLSHIYLISKGFGHTHTFDNTFVEEIRKYCVQSVYENRCRRRTTYMRPLDLTQDNPNPRFELLE